MFPTFRLHCAKFIAIVGPILQTFQEKNYPMSEFFAIILKNKCFFLENNYEDNSKLLQKDDLYACRYVKILARQIDSLPVKIFCEIAGPKRGA